MHVRTFLFPCSLFLVVCGCRAHSAFLSILFLWGFRITRASSYSVPGSVAHALYTLTHRAQRARTWCGRCHHQPHFTDADIKDRMVNLPKVASPRGSPAGTRKSGSSGICALKRIVALLSLRMQRGLLNWS